MAEAQSNPSRCPKCGRLTGPSFHHCPFIPATERFWSKVQVNDLEECWLWLGGRSPDGYGKFKVDGRTVRAHRFAWKCENGAIPTGMQVLHRCDVPLCCNVKHCLFLGTNDDNMADMVRKRRSAHGDRNVARRRPDLLRPRKGDKHPFAKLHAMDIPAIRASSEALGVLAVRYGVSKAAICMARKHQTWRHVL